MLSTCASCIFQAASNNDNCSLLLEKNVILLLFLRPTGPDIGSLCQVISVLGSLVEYGDEHTRSVGSAIVKGRELDDFSFFIRRLISCVAFHRSTLMSLRQVSV